MNKQFISKTIGVMVLLIALKIFISFGNELHSLGMGNYNIITAIVYMLSELPTSIYEFFPITVLLGALLALGNLASHKELIVMRVCGLSRSQLITALLSAMAIMLVGVLFIGEIIAPYALNSGQNMKTRAITKGNAYSSASGVWLRENRDFIYIENIDYKGILHNIVRYRFNEKYQMTAVDYANNGKYSNKKWQFNDITTSTIKSEKVDLSKEKTNTWPMDFSPQIIMLSRLSAGEKPLWQLYKQIETRKKNNLQSDFLEFNFWQRVLNPLAAIAMLGLALPFAFGSLQTTTIGLRIVIGSMAGLSFYLVDKFIGPLSIVYRIPPVMAALIPIILVAIISTIIWRVTR